MKQNIITLALLILFVFIIMLKWDIINNMNRIEDNLLKTEELTFELKTLKTNHKNILIWNPETKKVETIDGKVWEIWQLILYDSICKENFE